MIQEFQNAGPVGAYSDATCPINWRNPLNRGLVSEWAVNAPLLGWTGSRTLYDMVRGAKAGNNGTLTAGASWSSGQHGRCLSFNGSGGLVNAAPWTVSAPPFSCSCWFRANTLAGYRGVVGDQVVPGGLLLNITGGALTWIWNADAADYNAATGLAVTAGVWYFGALTITATAATVYLAPAGGPLSSYTLTAAQNSKTLTGGWQLGSERGAATLQYWDGLIGDCAVWGRALSAGEVYALYDQSRRGNPDRWNWLRSPSNLHPSSGSVTYSLSASKGLFTLSGKLATLTAQRKLTATVGTVSVAGSVATLTAQRKLSGGSGAFVFTGQAASVTAQRKLIAGLGSFLVSGSATALTKGYKLLTGVGTFVVTGQAATLTYSSSKTLISSAGTFSVTGIGNTLRSTKKLTAGTGSFALAGSAVSLSYGRTIQAGLGTVTLSGKTGGFSKTYKLVASVGPFLTVGRVATLTWSGFTPPVPPVTTAAIDFLHVRTFDIDFRLSSGGSVDF